MKIILIRHAKVLLDNKQKISASQMKAWVDEYNYAPIDKTKPTQELIALVENADVVLASSLSRASDSLDLIGVVPSEKNSLFDEIDLPSTNGTFIKLYAKTWLILLRLMMLSGFGKQSKVYKESKLRAIRASDYLIDLANVHESVALMGHGGMNWLLGKALLKSGWECVDQSGGNKNWGYKVYDYKDNKNEYS